MFASSLLDIYFHTFVMTCLGVSVIYWAILLSNFSRDIEALSGLLVGDGIVDFTGREGGSLSRFVEEGKYLDYYHGVGFSSEGGKGCLQNGGVFVGDALTESNLSSSLSNFPRTLSLSTTGVGYWVVFPKAVYFFIVA